MHATYCTPSLSRNKHQGAALIVGLIFLLVLTMIGVTTIQTSSLEERMAGNRRDSYVALLATETALRSAEGLVNTWTEGAPVFNVTTVPPTPAPDPNLAASWSAANSRELTGFVGLQTNGNNPRFMLEKADETTINTENTGITKKDSEVFYVTARSTGASGTAQVTVQSSVRRALSTPVY